jgi:hypothetical protein
MPAKTLVDVEPRKALYNDFDGITVNGGSSLHNEVN